MRIQNLVASDSGGGDLDGAHFSKPHVAGEVGSAPLEWNSGGGTKICNFKALQGAIGFDINPDSTANTSDILFCGSNSSENSTSCYNIGNPNLSATATNIKLVHMWVQCANSGPATIQNGVQTVILEGIMKNTGDAIKIMGGSHIVIPDGALICNNVASCVHIFDNLIPLIDIGHINCTACDATVFDGRNIHVGAMAAGLTKMDSVYPVVLTDTVNYIPFEELDIEGFRTAWVDVAYEGIARGDSYFYYHAIFRIQRPTSQVSPTDPTPQPVNVAAEYGPFTGGAPVDLQFDTTTMPGGVIIKARMPTGGGYTEQDGSLTVHVTGRVVKWIEHK